MFTIYGGEIWNDAKKRYRDGLRYITPHVDIVYDMGTYRIVEDIKGNRWLCINKHKHPTK